MTMERTLMLQPDPKAWDISGPLANVELSGISQRSTGRQNDSVVAPASSPATSLGMEALGQMVTVKVMDHVFGIFASLFSPPSASEGITLKGLIKHLLITVLCLGESMDPYSWLPYIAKAPSLLPFAKHFLATLSFVPATTLWNGHHNPHFTNRQTKAHLLWGLDSSSQSFHVTAPGLEPTVMSRVLCCPLFPSLLVVFHIVSLSPWGPAFAILPWLFLLWTGSHTLPGSAPGLCLPASRGQDTRCVLSLNPELLQ